ncbi:MAG: MotA/TolQ/ExbB proton channel family protein [Planctomycetia bacterium]|nr:MotA/TolQ/ExbB proton channel family protein [Planctomycetia bacterium]
MSSATTGKAPSIKIPIEKTGSPAEVLISPWVGGLVLAAGFYVAISQLPPSAAIVARYFNGSWAACAATGLFFIGCALLLRKYVELILDRRALRLIVVDADSLDGIDSPRERAAELVASTALVPASILRTKVVGRIHEVCHYVAGCRSNTSLEDHLRYRADLALETLAHSFAAVKTLLWGIPAVGLLGLVLGFITTIHAVNPQDLDASMPAIVGGFEAAFAPLAVSLGLSLVLLFGKLAVERAETRVLSQIEQFGILQVAPCFNFAQSSFQSAPLAAAEAEAAENLISQTTALVTRQTALWHEALEDLRLKWVESAQAQQAQFAAALAQGMAATLTGHEQQLDEARDEFLTGFRAVGLELARVTAGLQQMGEEHQELFHGQVTGIWRSMLESMSADRKDHETQMERLITLFEKSARCWHEELVRATDAVTAQIQELQQKGEVLQGIAEQERELVRLQDALAHNLQSVRAVEAFEESIHSLNAAVHMLTIRAKAHAA